MDNGYYTQLDMNAWRVAQFIYLEGELVTGNNMHDFIYVGYAPTNVTLPAMGNTTYTIHEFLLDEYNSRCFMQVLYPGGEIVETPHNSEITVVIDDASSTYYPQYVTEDGTILYHFCVSVHALS